MPQPTFSADLRITQPLETFASYAAKIARAKDYLRAGDIYQVCLSQEMVLEGEIDPFGLFCRLYQLNPAPYAAYLDYGDEQIVSSSPERFFSRRGVNVVAEPIKGTMPRGKTAAEDEAHRDALLSSPKECAELAMIVDLMRNDLGRFARIGSVHVPRLYRLLTFPNVFHLVGEVCAEVEGDTVDLLRGCFPAGSISGCPKLRALEIIEELEQRERGIYTGTIGVIWEGGDCDFSVAIRTLSIRAGRVSVQLGGAIGIDSDARAEYEETIHKGESIFAALNA